MKKQIILIAAVILCTVSGFSQVKLGHINSQEILSLMPEMKEAEQSITAYRSQLEQRMVALQTEYQNKVTAFEGLDMNTPQSTVEDMRNEIMGLQQRIQEFQATAEQDLISRNEQVLQPLLTKVQDAINEVGTENSFTYIFDLSTGTVVFQNGQDISAMVKSKLGI